MNVLAIIQQFFRYMTKDKDILYVFCPFSIGDFLVVGGLCHTLLKKKRKKTCVLILNDIYAKNSGLINFVGVTEIVYISTLLREIIRQYVFATREFETDNFIYAHFHTLEGINNWTAVHAWNPNLSIADRWKENVLGLPLDTKVISPIIPPPR